MPEASTREEIKTLGPDGLERLVSELGEPRFRTRQLVRWLYGHSVTDWEAMTDLPKTLRTQLASGFALSVPELVERRTSQRDDTRKYLWRLADGQTIESVGLPAGERLTVCFSTQVGCAMGCAFCATGRSGYVRDLSPGEMVDQVRLVGLDFSRRVTNAVAMGQGEPFAAYDATIAGLRFMNTPDGLGIGARHLTVSTCGLVPGIRAFAEEPEQFTLAVSLHSAVQETRDRLMPAMRAWPLDALHQAVIDYTMATGRRVSFEYALIDGINDTKDEISALRAYVRGVLCHVNLIPVNPVEGSTLRTSPAERSRTLAQTLATAGVEVSVREERGADIDAACGQLSQRFAAEGR